AQGAPAVRGVRRMTAAARYWRLFRVQVRSSVLLGLQYRADFLVDGLVSLFWTLTALVPLFTVFHLRQTVAGWTFEEALLVTGWFTLLEAILWGAPARPRPARAPPPWWSTSARAPWTSCSSSPPTHSSWSPQRASNPGGAPTSSPPSCSGPSPSSGWGRPRRFPDRWPRRCCS